MSLLRRVAAGILAVSMLAPYNVLANENDIKEQSTVIVKEINMPNPSGFVLVDYDFEEPSDTMWGFSKSGSEFEVVHNNGQIQFKGGNTSSTPGVSELQIPMTEEKIRNII